MVVLNMMSRMAALIMLTSATLSMSASQVATKRVVHVVAERFQFTPSEIKVDAGTVIEIRLTSEDTAHGFKIAGPSGVDVTIPKRGRGEMVVTFEAAEPGTYVFECSRMCGAGHSFMRGQVKVK